MRLKLLQTKVFAGAMCVAMAAGGVPAIGTVLSVPAQAAGSSVKITFKKTGISIKSWKVGKYGDSARSNYNRMYADGDGCTFCIEPGKSLRTGNVLTKNTKAWDALSDSKQTAIKHAIQFGYAGTNYSKMAGSNNEKWMANQLIVWEFVTGARSASYPYTLKDSSIKKSVSNGSVQKDYAYIVKKIQEYGADKPSFSSKDSSPSYKTYKKFYRPNDVKEDKVYKIKDTNHVLDSYSITSSSKSSKYIQVSKSGNTLQVKVKYKSMPENKTQYAKIKLTYNAAQKRSSVGKITFYDDGDHQAVSNGSVDVKDKVFYYKVAALAKSRLLDTGLNIQKVDSDGNEINEAGVKFSLYKSETDQTPLVFGQKSQWTTDDSGEAEIIGIDPGTYYVQEDSAPNGYTLSQKRQKVLVEEGRSATFKFKDAEQFGSVRIVKTGDALSGTVDGDTVTYPDGSQTVEKNPAYSEKNLQADFDVVAAEDIYYANGKQAFRKGEAAATVESAESGKAEDAKITLKHSSDPGLPFGTYTIKETSVNGKTVDSPYEIREDLGTVTLDADHTVSTQVINKDVSYHDELKTIGVTLKKQFESDAAYGIDGKDSLTSAVFGLYAKEDIYTTDGKTLVWKAGDLIDSARAAVTEDSEDTAFVSFQTNVPAGKYYVQEISTDAHYNLDPTKYEVEFTNTSKDSVLLAGSSKTAEEQIQEAGGSTDSDAKDSDTTDSDAADPDNNKDTGSTTDSDQTGGDSKDADNTNVGNTADDAAKDTDNTDPDNNTTDTDNKDSNTDTSDTDKTDVTDTAKDTETPAGDGSVPAAPSPQTEGEEAAGDPAEDTESTTDHPAEDTGSTTDDPKSEDTTTDDPDSTEEDTDSTLEDETYDDAADTDDPDAEIDHGEDVADSGNNPVVNTLKRGKLILTKKDKLDGEDVTGAEYSVYMDRNGNGKLDEEEGTAVGTLDDKGDGTYVLENVPYGSYIVKETKAPKNYRVDETSYAVTITKNGEDGVVNGSVGYVEEAPMVGKVQVKKVDAAHTDKTLAGAEFTVYDSSKKPVGSLKDDDKNGTYELENVRIGTYTLKETKAPEGYKADPNTYAFTIRTDNEVVTVENLKGKGLFTDEQAGGEIALVKVDKADTSKKLSQAVFAVYKDSDGDQKYSKSKDKRIGSLTETSKGTYTMKELAEGGYFVVETKAPAGYKLDSSPVYVEVVNNQTVYASNTDNGKKVFTNTKKTTSATKKTKDTTITKRIIKTVIQKIKTGDPGMYAVLAAIAAAIVAIVILIKRRKLKA